ncbi:MAG: TonB-dependent receptor [Bacteroidetes bacterium]|nr:MAG: TonB-dependent receptor [Bacteroidota bacterium]
MKKILFSILALLISFNLYSQNMKTTISGYVKEKNSGELLIGVNIYLQGTQIGTVSNTYGFYSLTIPPQEATVIYSFVGYKPVKIPFGFDKDTVINIILDPNIELSEVEIYSERDKISDKAEMSVVSIPVEQIRQIPALLGEKDVFKVLQLMPGIRSGSEASSGLYVRGGGPDQNLTILDEAPVYNAMHLFGFFSVFNGDAIKSIEMYKGGFPARYGGRLSSVIDMTLKDGNKQKFGGEGSIGLLSSRLLLEGPIVKNKSSFMISGRRTYVDVLTRPFMNLEDGTAGYYFYDLNAKVNYEISDKDKIYLSGYFGRDKFFGGYDDSYGSEQYKLFWENATSTLRWNHQFSKKLFSNTSIIYSNYQFVIDAESEYQQDYFHLRYKSGIRDIGVKTDFSWIPSPDHYIRTGFNFTNHLFTPSAVVLEIASQTIEQNVQELNSLESAMYIEDEWHIIPQMKMNAGLRLSSFTHNTKSYFGIEPRLLLSYMFTDMFSIKASYAEMNQYVHLLTSTGIGLPTDLWVPSTDRIGPQHSRQFAMGLAHDFEDPSYTISLEGYYKTMDDIISYKEGSSFLMIDDPTDQSQDFHYEDAVTVGKGYSYGLEFLLQRKFGKLTGWIGYTLSLTKYKFAELNNGNEFFPRHDRRHDISVVAIYKISDVITLSATWVYGTGDAITLANSTYNAYTHNPNSTNNGMSNEYKYFSSSYANYYGEKNSFRMEAYHRLDIGAQFSKKLKWGGTRTIEVSIYNAYNHLNPFFYYTGYDNRRNETVLKQFTLFPILPSVAYYLKF